MSKLRVFVSSVQKELEHERIALSSVFTTDPFLLQHCDPVLFEKLPSSGRPQPQAYLDCLGGCQVYVALLAREYGQIDGDLSATHHEYRRAQALKMPTLIFVKGESPADETREEKTREFFNEIRRDGHTYKRFIDREDLKPEARAALLRVLKENFQIAPTSDEAAGGRDLLEATSPFEAMQLPNVPATTLDEGLVAQLAANVGIAAGLQVFDDAVCSVLHARGLVWQKDARSGYFATTAGNLMFGPRPADGFPQCEILVDAYTGTTVNGRPRGQLTLNRPLPRALEEILAFIDQHTFHPTRVVGINNVTLDEYPVTALREALVNAVAHRDYSDAARKITVQVFADRAVVSSPGLPPSPLTLAKLQRGTYRSCSRNPVLAQTLATLKLMEQRGSGFARMRDAMLDHGLAAPHFAQQDGYFVVTFPGPNGKYERLKVPADARGLTAPSVEAQLNERQRQMAALLAAGESLTSGRCEKEFGVTRDTTARDFRTLVELGLAVKQGQGRAVHYVSPRTS